MILVKNAILIDEYTEQKEDILIEGRNIKYIGKNKIDKFIEEKKIKDDIKVIDAKGKYLLPSFRYAFSSQKPGT